MESINKFKILSVLIICMGLFSIAAMYVRTKDITDQKAPKNPNYEQSEYNNNVESGAAIDEVAYSVEKLERKVRILEEKIDRNATSKKSSDSVAGGTRCKIYGTKTRGGIEALSSEAALQDARINGNDIVVTCSLK